MKFVNYLESITGVSIYPLVSLCIFVPFFLFVLVWLWKTDKQKWDKIAHIPLEDE